MNRPMATMLAFAATTLLGTTILPAQEQVAPLRDLIGAKGRDAEPQMQNRGYKPAGGSKAGDSSFTYWREPMSNRCVAVRTTEGRYASIVYTSDGDCQGGGAATQLPASTGNSEDNFATVCGVINGGKEFRYRCTLRNEGCKGGGSCRMTVTMPDNEYTVTWHKGDEIDVAFAGMNPGRSTASFQNGQTRFDFGGNTYFVYRSPDRAQKELANLH